MKARVYSITGSPKGEVVLPAFFEKPIRKDLVRRAVEAEKQPQPYGIAVEAGRRHSASGIISHKRHDWKGQYGRGIARTPRKILWRRGTQFNWVGAEVSNTRGGRRPHGPKPARNTLRMNKKEYALALQSALAATAHIPSVKERYLRLEHTTLTLPLVIESPRESVKIRVFKKTVEQIAEPVSSLLSSHETVRAGRGKLRGRRYKRLAGILLITGSKETVIVGGVKSTTLSSLEVQDLYPLGRIVIFTESAVEEMKTL